MKTQTNSQLELANNFVRYTGKNIFLTGKAGTGKTTFLHNLKKDLPKRMIVVAPTGVAAINAGGVTIHSFFQLPFGPVIPGFSKTNTDKNNYAQYHRFSKEKRNIMKSLDLLIIDEISMVRADVLDGIDETLRKFRNQGLPFGGVQLLMIGDMQQLAPVVKDDEWEMLRKYYDTAFFFSSHALRQTSYISIELIHVYRQTDHKFISLLNKVRENQPDHETIGILNSRYKQEFSNHEGYITLTTHNAKASAINNGKLNKLPGKTMKFIAEVKGNFPEYSYPTEYELSLKTDAQVMFVKNDPNPAKEYFNGKIGRIVNIDNDHVFVKCQDDDFTIKVSPIEWQNYKYIMDSETKEIRETVDGVFIQMPLKLAWAITIHKSQGLTFEKAIIDAQAAFAFGQVYVALSRCKSLDGLVLSSKIDYNSIKSSPTISKFNKYIEENQPGDYQLQQSKKDYQTDLLFDLFDFKSLDKSFFNLAKIMHEHARILNQKVMKEFVEIQENFREKILLIAERFKPDLKYYIESCENIETHQTAMQRLQKASCYFTDNIGILVIDPVEHLEIDCDNTQVNKKVTETIGKIIQEAHYKKACQAACKNGFVLKDYIAERAKASLQDEYAPARKKKTTDMAGQNENNELYNILRSWRSLKAAELGWSAYQVFHQKTLFELCEIIPGTRKALKEIHGLGKRKLEQFGDELLEVLNDYRIDQGMKIPQPEDPPEKQKKLKSDTKETTLNFWKSGLGIEDIAKERGMATSTISGHLAYWVEQGDIPVQHLVSEEKIEKIRSHYFENEPQSMTEVKEALGDNFTYNEIRFVLCSMRAAGKIKN